MIGSSAAGPATPAQDASSGRTRLALALGSALAIGASVLLLLMHRAGVHNGLENGIFAHDCCGRLELRDGIMRLNGKQEVSYSLGSDAGGPYILPRTYVGAFEDKGLEVDGTRVTIKLRLDRSVRPTQIVLYEGLTPYEFKRTAEAFPK